MRTILVPAVLLFLGFGAVNISQAQWVKTNGPDGGYVTALLITHDSSYILAGTQGSGVFRLSKSKTTWSEENNGLTNPWINCLAQTPSGEDIFAGTYNGLFHSSNTGTSWVQSGLAGDVVRGIAVSPIDSTQIFAATSDSGIYVSTDNGESWKHSMSGIQTDIISRVVWSPDGKDVFALTGAGLYRSTDDGNNWVNISPNDNSTYLSMGVSPAGTNLFLYTAQDIYGSTDNGNHWSPISNPFNIQIGNNTIPVPGDVFAFSPDGSKNFIGTEGNGVYVSNDNGSTWKQTGLSGYYVYALRYSQDGSELVAGTMAGGVFLSTDNGADWTQLDNGLNAADISTIASYSNSSGGINIFAGTYGYDYTNGSIFLSQNMGNSWTESNEGLKSPESPYYGYDILSFGISADKSFVFAALYRGGIFRSSDNGAHWSEADSGIVTKNDPGSYYINILAVSPYEGSLYAGGSNDYGGNIYRSTDNGSTWVKTGFSNRGFYPTCLAFTKSNSGREDIFTGTYNDYFGASYEYIFMSNDTAKTWAPVDSVNVKDNIIVLAVSDTNLFVGTSNGLFLATSNGLKEIDHGFADNYITALAVSGSKLFAGTAYDGIYFTSDNGAHWKQINDGLTNTEVNTLSVSADGKELLVGVFGAGMWKRSLSDITAVKEEEKDVPSNFTLNQNYPNPFNPSTTISYSLPKSSNVNIEVFNVLGEKVATLVNEYERAGNHKAQWNAGRFASGVYFYRLQAGNYSAVKKLLLLK